jgi:hypothetical protein
MSESSPPNVIKDPLPAEIYEQDCQFARHQDSLMWGRFQTAATIEGGLLAGLYALDPPGLGDQARWFVLGATVLMAILSALSIKDACDARRHLNRLQQFESQWPLRDSRWPPHSGFVLMCLAIATLTIVNAVLLYHYW